MQSLPECVGQFAHLRMFRRKGQQHAEPRDLPRRLRFGSEGPGDRAASQGADERSSVHYQALTWPRHAASEIRHLTSLMYRNESGGRT